MTDVLERMAEAMTAHQALYDFYQAVGVEVFGE